MQNGKGSNPRPLAVSKEDYQDSWTATFGCPDLEQLEERARLIVRGYLSSRYRTLMAKWLKADSDDRRDRYLKRARAVSLEVRLLDMLAERDPS